jgi:hypothetical protein
VWQSPQATHLFTTLAKDEVERHWHLRSCRRHRRELRQASFTVVGTDNAPQTTRTTTVSHPQVLDTQAEALASRLPDARAGQDTGAAVAAVSLVVGTDLDPGDIR